MDTAATADLNIEQKRNLIWAIIAHLRFAASERKQAFDAGDTFLALAFKSDDELRHIARLAGV